MVGTIKMHGYTIVAPARGQCYSGIYENALKKLAAKKFQNFYVYLVFRILILYQPGLEWFEQAGVFFQKLVLQLKKYNKSLIDRFRNIYF